MAKSLIDLDALKGGRQTGPLSEETQEQIRQQADIEIAEEEAARNKPDENADDKKPDIEPDKKEIPEDKKPDPTDEEKQKIEIEEKAVKEKEIKDKAEADLKTKDEDILVKKDEDLAPEEKTRKIELLKVQADADSKEIELYAAAEKISVEEAKKVLESEKKILEKYQNEPKKLARAYVSSQREYGRLQSRMKAEQEKAATVLHENEVVIHGKKTTFEEAKPTIVDAYRGMYPEKTEALDDDAVLSIAKKEYQEKVKDHLEGIKAKNAEEAKSRRAKIILSIPDSAEPYRESIEEMINNAPDERILQEDYDPTDMISWARGNHYSPEKIKELEDAAFKRGQENAKILGEKKPGAQSGGGGSPAKKETGGEGLSADQKQRALDMWSGVSVWDDERKFKEYIEHMKSVGEWPEKK
jgi:hypothetical protein